MCLEKMFGLRSPHRAPTAAVLLALVLTAGACTSGPAPGVNVRSVATDLVYGIPPTPDPAPPANTAPEPVAPLGTVIRPSGPQPQKTLEPIQPRDVCPDPKVDDFPRPATSAVDGRPAEGSYRWIVDGTRVTQIGRIRLASAEVRQIQNVQTTTMGFEFTMAQRDYGSQDTVFTTFEVRNAQSEDGVYLTQIQRVNSEREVTFDPAPAVLVLPLPVEFGTEFSSVGVDPVSQEALRHQGTVKDRQRVNACGRWMDGWFVDAQRTFVGADGGVSQANYDYTVAVQFGAMLAFEHVESPCAPNEENECPDAEPTLEFDAHIGQVEPG